MRTRGPWWGLLLGACAATAAQAGAPEPAQLPAVVPAPARPPLADASTTLTDDPAAEDPDFPRYARLEPAIRFWTDVFGKYSENQTAIHSSRYPGKVFEVLDFRADAARMTAGALAREKSERESASKARMDRLLRQVHAKRHDPQLLTADERRVFALYADVPGDNRFLEAVGSFRAQRGLKERTATALRTSGSYLPQMERTFGQYDLPVRLTRLPLVESSFNVEAYSKVGAAGLWQFMPSSARIYMRMNDIVDDRRDPWTSTDAAARHLRDDYAMLKSWPLALTAYNHGRGGIARGLQAVNGKTLVDLIDRYDSPRFGFASRNFYAEFIAAVDVEHNYRRHFGELARNTPLMFDVVETQHYVPYDTLRELCKADDALFRKLNPAYRPEVIDGKLYVPPGSLVRVPAGEAQTFQVAYSKLGEGQLFSSQRVFYSLYKVRKGDSLGRIARSQGVSADSIQRVNGLGRSTRLRVGSVLKIPPRIESRPGPITVAVGESKPVLTRAETAAAKAAQAPARAASAVASKQPLKAKAQSVAYRTHHVRSGQTLSAIAEQYRVSVSDIQRANNLGRSARIKAGQKLRIPPSV